MLAFTTALKSTCTGIVQSRLFVLVCLFTLLLSACHTDNRHKRFRVAFSQCTGGDDWRRTMLDEMKRELSFHENVELIYRNADANSVTQVRQINELTSMDIDLLIVTPNEVQPLTPVIEKVFESGVPVVVVDRRINSKKYTAFIGASNLEVGRNAGMYAASLLKGKGRVIEMAGLPAGASPPIDRHNGFMQVLANYPGIRFVQLFDNLSREDSFLRTNPDIDLIYAQNDFMAREAHDVCVRLGLEKKIRIIGVDGLATPGGGLDMVEQGLLSATVLYPTGGQEAIRTAVNILNGQPYKKDHQLSTTLIDSTNIIITKLQNEKVLAQQTDIDRRQQKIEEQESITANQDRIIWAISITLALSLLMGAVLFYFLKENRKISARLAAQNEEIVLQRNQLIELGKKAKAATDAKFNFFTNISHELRTPLTLILGPADELLSSPKLSPAARNHVEVMKRNGQRLLKLVNELMDFRKVEEAKMKLRVTENNIAEFVEEITHAFETTVARKKISFKTVSNVGDLKVWFDVNMLDKILFNLLSNALKYTGEFGSISVSLNKDAESVTVKVEDSGIGMDPETLEHAFDLFYQGEDGRYKGTGLGLALSKELIILHHGSITIQSEKGRGATFEMRLLLGNSHFSADEICQEKESYALNPDEARIFVDEASEQHPPLASSYGTKEQTVLLIEDNTGIRQFLAERLGTIYEVMQADNGDMGLSLAFEALPDIIVSDVLLPGKNGLLITEVLKKDVRTAHIPIILLTARAGMEQQAEGLALNADAYMVKPFKLTYLESVIRSLLNNRQSMKQRFGTELAIAPARDACVKKTDRKFISEFKSVIEQNISNEKFSVNDICQAMGLSRVPLYRKVKAILGININQYIMDVRLQKAKYLLAHEDLSISEVSFQVGFASQTYFSTVFKSRFGMTPKNYREQGMAGGSR